MIFNLNGHILIFFYTFLLLNNLNEIIKLHNYKNKNKLNSFFLVKQGIYIKKKLNHYVCICNNACTKCL